MRVFNRIVMVIGILVSIALALFVVLRPMDAVQIAQTNISLFDESLYNSQFQLVFIVGVAVWIALLLFLLVLELRRPRKKTVKIRTDSGANAVLGVESVMQSLEYRIDELAGVRKVVPHVRSRGKDLDVAIDLDTSPSVNIAALTDQVVALSRDIIENQLGVKMHGKVSIFVRHEPYPRGTMPAAAPAAAPVTQAQPKVVEATPVQARPTEQAPEAKPAALREAVREPRRKRELVETQPHPEAAPTIVTPVAPAPVEAAPAQEQGPAPLGDLTPFEPTTEPREANPADAAASDVMDKLDDLDEFDPTERDE